MGEGEGEGESEAEGEGEGAWAGEGVWHGGWMGVEWCAKPPPQLHQAERRDSPAQL